jgi:environmental stress-induced protein Ves
MELADLKRSQVIPANEYRRERWRNPVGLDARDRPLARGGRLDLALVHCQIERDSAFSAFPGSTAKLVLLLGNGLRLRFDDGQVHELEPPHGKLALRRRGRCRRRTGRRGRPTTST